MSRRLPALLSLAMVTALAVADDGHVERSPAGDRFAKEMHAGMEAMRRAMAIPMTGDPDIDFLAMMIPHHEAAIEMARLQLVYGNDPLVRRLAEEIIASQHTEIAAMRQRLRLLRERTPETREDYPSLGGTRGAR